MRIAARPLAEPVRSNFPDARSYDMARARHFAGLLAPLWIATLVFLSISFVVTG